MKRCKPCGTDRPLSEFSKRASEPDGFSYRCKDCDKAAREKSLANKQRSTVEQKTCSQCKVLKSAADFTRDKNSKDCLSWYCRECSNARAKARRLDPVLGARVRTIKKESYGRNRESILADMRERRAANRPAILERERQRRRDNPLIHEAKIKWAADNPEKVKLSIQKCRVKNRKKQAERARAYRLKNQADVQARQKEWRDANVEHVRLKARMATHRRRELLRQSGASVTTDEWKDICAAFDHRCACCQHELPLTMDHVVPLSRGGAHIASNIVPACLSCNCSKSNKSIEQWLAIGGPPRLRKAA